ncbi:unnamed protein product [Rhizoctonia solani]|uniref:Fungal-specific transcription factor domain protein n=1 Tax=Rhizoctonia solani TaxID=456999 RepID=A0A8H3G9N4_9AGAM|nr:unnamed protein product [Rhizoctonia solani]
MVNTGNHTLVRTPSNMSAVSPMTSGQASLLAALFSLGQYPDPDPPSQRSQPSTGFPPDPDIPWVSYWSKPDAERLDNVTSDEDEDPKSINSKICRELVLNKTSESNALPFVLQNYAIWVHRMAFQPLKLMSVARDFVFNQFQDGEQSRWIIVLLANISSRMESEELVGGKTNRMLSLLHTAVRQQLGAVKSLRNQARPELVKVLDSAVETMLRQFYVNRSSDALTVRREVAPIFRQLCPGPPDAPIDLRALLQQPLGSLRHFAHIDIHFSVVTGVPTLFQYDVDIPSSQPSTPDTLPSPTQGDGFVQWLHGTPSQFVLLFAKMSSIRHSGSTSNRETIAALEQEIHRVQPLNNPPSDRFLAIMRSVVQECWRQAALVYLYMAVCGDPSGTPRVKEAFKRYMKLLRGTQPGRLPDEFLITNLTLIAPAAQQGHDRETIRQRILGAHMRGPKFRTNNIAISVVEDYWTRADAEGRQAIWSDLALSRKRVLGV